MRISVLVSGGGTNLQAVLNGIESGLLGGVQLVRVISSKRDAYALQRARDAGVLTAAFERRDDINGENAKEEQMNKIVDELDAAATDLVVLAGFLPILSDRFTERYRGRIINIHPSLLPKHGGIGCYGIHVHERVLAAGDRVTGATVHLVVGEVDGGEILIQKSVPVLAGDSPDTLGKRVLAVEHEILPKAILMMKEKIKKEIE